MAEPWTHSEVAATVADYLDMFMRGLRGESFSKKEHNRRLQVQLSNRSAGAIEFKHQNISAILIELGLAYIEGYKPRANYQELLRVEVVAQLARNPEIEKAMEAIVEAAAQPVRLVAADKDVFVNPPKPEKKGRVYERAATNYSPRRINYLERESRNRSLGHAGELFVVDVERSRLRKAGCKSLAERIEHISESRGDGLGYDVVSYETDGRERLIEVKTTAFGAMTPFFATAKEVAVSDTLPTFQLYRVFKFRDDAKIFHLPGPLSRSCLLEATQFRASVA